MIQVMIIDDHPMIAKGLKDTLTHSGSIEVCAIAATAKQALLLIPQCRIDLIVLDLKLPDDNGMHLCKEILKQKPDIKILVFSSYNQRYYIKAMVQLGVQGYLLKSAAPEIIIEAIIQISEGENYFCPEVRELLKENEPTIYLSPRELEVLTLIAGGLTNNEISEKLFISPLTADSHRKNLILKLGAKNTASLIRIATSDGYL